MNKVKTKTNLGETHEVSKQALPRTTLNRAAKAAITRNRELEEEADRAHLRLLRKETATFSPPNGFVFKDGGSVSTVGVRFLVRQKRAKIENNVLKLSSPEEYEEQHMARQRQADANRRARLNFWSQQITDAVGVKVEDGKLDEVIERIFLTGSSTSSITYDLSREESGKLDED